MRRYLCGSVGVALLAVLFSMLVSPSARNPSMADDKSPGKHIVHNVFFALNESTPAARKTLVDACYKYLTDHEGTVYFSAGVLCDSLNRPVNDRDFDVGLHIVFASMPDHDRYQDHPRHTKFIEENKSTWKKVRVFDSEVPAKTK
jgi:hypothetical protein